MGYRRTLGAALWGELSAGAVLVSLCGCAMMPPNSFLDPTKVGRFGMEGHEGGIRRILTPRDTPPGLANATEPVPEDLVAYYEEYRLAPGDVVALTVGDLFAPGLPFSATLEVSPLGELRIPELGSVKVVGLTEQELEQEFKARLKEGRLLPNPLVMAFIQVKRGRVVSMLGAVGAQGPYPIMNPDMRLLELIAMAGGVMPQARKAYVIRQVSTPVGRAPIEPPPATPMEEPFVIPPPIEEGGGAPGAFLTSLGLSQDEQEPPGTPDEPTLEELAEIMAPEDAQSPPATSPSDEVMKRAFEPLVFDPQTGQVLQVTPQERADVAAEELEEPLPPDRADVESFEEPFDWEDVEDIELAQRVIAIDLVELKNGNPRYNIVLRDRDVVNVPMDTGVFYLMGEINRPGVFAFGGREITVKRALAISGGFSAMAWPQRCEIIRREPGTDKQMTIPVNMDAIFAGLEDDFYLRDDDILNVGTHIVAPFLFVIRNSFRFTYGFGFVYDRNFADKDAYGGRLNPEILAQQQQAQRGLPF